MMDGRILAIRETLDKAGYVNTPIMSYAVKYASAFYGRSATRRSPPRITATARPIRWTPPTRWKAWREAAADIDEGADIVMVKPAGPYLDVIRMVRDNFDVPGRRLSGERRVLHDQGRRHQRLDR